MLRVDEIITLTTINGYHNYNVISSILDITKIRTKKSFSILKLIIACLTYLLNYTGCTPIPGCFMTQLKIDSKHELLCGLIVFYE